jgi:glycosyltransferase involved in cell wall biosynthesis
VGRVDILVHTFQNESTVERCIRSILNQTYEETYVTVIDDSSADGTWRILEELAAQFSGHLDIKRTASRLGSATSARREVGFSPLGAFWGMIDGDDWWIAEDKVEKQVRLLNRRSEAVGCSGIATMTGQSGEELALIRPGRSPWTFLDFMVGAPHLYVHVSTILWKTRFYGPGRFMPNIYGGSWPRGEWPLTLATLAETRGEMIHLEDRVAVYNFSGLGVWSSKTQLERDLANSAADSKMRKLAPLRYKLGALASKRGHGLTARCLNRWEKLSRTLRRCD